MEEKRKLEKLLFADIEKADAKYASNRATARNIVSKQALSSTELLAEYDLFLSLTKQLRESEERIQQMGFGVNRYNDEKPYIREAFRIPALRDFDDTTTKVRETLSELKRTYTMKLFAGGEEAKDLFASLATELAAIR
jgi:hypothetical protein